MLVEGLSNDADNELSKATTLGGLTNNGCNKNSAMGNSQQLEKSLKVIETMKGNNWKPTLGSPRINAFVHGVFSSMAGAITYCLKEFDQFGLVYGHKQALLKHTRLPDRSIKAIGAFLMGGSSIQLVKQVNLSSKHSGITQMLCFVVH